MTTKTTKKNTAAKKPAAATKAEQKPAAATAADDKPWRKYADKFDRVTVDAEVPGVGTMKIDLVQVELDGEKFRAPTRKECQTWLREQRKAKAVELKIARDAERERKSLEKAEKMGPAVTDRLAKTAARIETLATNPTVDEADAKALADAVAAIRAVVAKRVAADAAADTDAD